MKIIDFFNESKTFLQFMETLQIIFDIVENLKMKMLL
jgi:hypothetical protein